MHLFGQIIVNWLIKSLIQLYKKTNCFIERLFPEEGGGVLLGKFDGIVRLGSSNTDLISD